MKQYLLISVLGLLFNCYSTEIITGSSQDTSVSTENCLGYPVAYVSGDREAIPGQRVYLWLTLHPLVCKEEITGFEWSQIAGPAVHLTNTGSDNTSFIAPPEYEEIFLRVTIKGRKDDYTDNIKIKVVDREEKRVPFASADGDIVLPADYPYKTTAYYSLGTNRANMSYLWTTLPEPNPVLSISARESAEPLITLLRSDIAPQIVLLETIEDGLRSTRDIKIVYPNNNSSSIVLPPRFEPVSSDIRADPGSTVELKVKDLNRYSNVSLFWFQLAGEKVNYTENGLSISFSAPSFPDDIVFVSHVRIDGLFSPPVFHRIKVGNQNGLIDPVANAGPDQKVRTLSEVSLNGSKSMVSYPRKISYRWRQVYGSNINIRNSDTAFPSFTAPRIIGKLIIMLIVNDGYTDSRPDTVVIDVTNE